MARCWQMQERVQQKLLAQKKGIPSKDHVTIEVAVAFIWLPFQEGSELRTA